MNPHPHDPFPVRPRTGRSRGELAPWIIAALCGAALIAVGVTTILYLIGR